MNPDKNEHFHDIVKGCKLQDFNLKKNHSYLKMQRCLTHGKTVCHCGWAYGWHGGVFNGSGNYINN